MAELKIEITGASSVKNALDAALQKAVKDLADDVYAMVVPLTPVRSGNARRNWTKTVSGNNFSIENHVPYIERLDQGWSKQAPNGIMQPLIDQIKRKYP